MEAGLVSQRRASAVLCQGHKVMRIHGCSPGSRCLLIKQWDDKPFAAWITALSSCWKWLAFFFWVEKADGSGTFVAFWQGNMRRQSCFVWERFSRIHRHQIDLRVFTHISWPHLKQCYQKWAFIFFFILPDITFIQVISSQCQCKQTCYCLRVDCSSIQFHAPLGGDERRLFNSHKCRATVPFLVARTWLFEEQFQFQKVISS